VKHNRKEEFERYEKLKNTIRKKVEEEFARQKKIQSSVFPYFDKSENKWKTKIVNYK
jgi:hypothetical protein